MTDVEWDKATDSIEDMVRNMRSDDASVVLAGIQAIRKLSQQDNPLIQELIDNGVVELCTEFLDSKEDTITFEAVWVLTNIASGTSAQTMTIVKADAVPQLLRLLQSTGENQIAEQSAWALGNIAGDGDTARAIVWNCGVADAIKISMQTERSVTFLCNVAWLILNLCRSDASTPLIDKKSSLFPVILQLLDQTNEKILMDAVWALFHVTDNSEGVAAICEAGFVPKLIRLLDVDNSDVTLPVLRTIGNIAAGSDDDVDVILNANLLEYMQPLLSDSRPKIALEAVFLMGNITAGNTQQLQFVIDGGLFEDIRDILLSGDHQLMREAARAVANATINATPDQIHYFVKSINIFRPFCNLIRLNDPKVDLMVKDALFDVLKIGGCDMLTMSKDGTDVSHMLNKIQSMSIK